MKVDRYTNALLRLLEGTLDAKAEAELLAKIDQSVELREELERLQETRILLQGTMRTAGETALKPFFTDRLMKQLASGKDNGMAHDDLAFFLGRMFRPVALAGFFIAMFLAVYNVNLSADFASDTSTAEAILALPPVNTMAVYDLDLYVGGDPTTSTFLP